MPLPEIKGHPKTEEERAATLRAVCREFVKLRGSVQEWSTQGVSEFLSACSDRGLLGQHRSTSGLSLADTFRKHGVRGRQLLSLDGFSGNQQLKAQPFNIASLGQRIKLLDAVKVLMEEEVEHLVVEAAEKPAESDGGAEFLPAAHDGCSVSELLGRCVSAKPQKVSESQAGDIIHTVPGWHSTAFPPSSWCDPGHVGRAAPLTELELEFIFGYNGSRARGNLCCNDAGELIFPVSRYAVVFNIETRTQRFFLKHTDEVSAVRMHPDQIVVASGEYGCKGTICVWDSQSIETLAILPRAVSSWTSGAGAQAQVGVSALSFGGKKGEILAAVTEDMLVMVWHWKEERLIVSTSHGKGHVYDARAMPYKEARAFTLVTAGTLCVKFWTLKMPAAAVSKGAEATIKESGASKAGTAAPVSNIVPCHTQSLTKPLLIWSLTRD